MGLFSESAATATDDRTQEFNCRSLGDDAGKENSNSPVSAPKDEAGSFSTASLSKSQSAPNKVNEVISINYFQLLFSLG